MHGLAEILTNLQAALTVQQGVHSGSLPSSEALKRTKRALTAIVVYTTGKHDWWCSWDELKCKTGVAVQKDRK